MSASTDDKMAAMLRTEIYADAEQQASAVFGGTPSDGQAMRRGKYMEFVRRNLGYPDFLTGLLQRVGPDEFRLQVCEAAGQEADTVWPLPEEVFNG